jgi:putative ABC transport system permease protein
METLLQDIRYGFRTLIKKPGFTALVVIALSLGIGATTAIFSVVNATLLRSLPYHEPDRLVIPVSINPSRNIDRGGVSYADYLDWKNETGIFKHVAVFQRQNADLTDGGEPERVSVGIVSEDYFSVMGARPVLGRTYLPEEYQPGATRALVVSYGLWQRKFGGDPGIIERTITLNGRQYQVIGVMPKDSQYPGTDDLWAALAVGPNPPPDFLRRDNQVYQAVARLKDGVSVEQATTVLQTIALRVEQEHPESLKGWSAGAIPLHDYVIGPTLRRALLVLFGAVAFVLLIACVNVANLMLARAARREREIAIRIALGAGRGRLIRQLLTESILLAFVSGAVGFLLALWGVDLLTSLAPDNLPRLDEVNADARVLIFVIATSMLTALAFGLVPALQATKTDLNEALKEGGRGSTGGVRGASLRSALVISEVALSLMLLVGAGLMVRSFMRLQRVDPGLNVDNLLTMEIYSPGARYKERSNVADFYRQLVDRIDDVAGVESVAASSALPLGGGGFYLGRQFLVEGRAEPPAGPDNPAQWNVVTPGYFGTLGIKVVKGRAFNDRDTTQSTPVIIINETLAREMFYNEEPLGKRIRSWRDENTLREIVGVVQDTRYFGRDDELRSLVYVPHSQDSWRSMSLAVRTSGDPSGFAGAIRNAISDMDKDLAVSRVQTMKQILNDSVATPRFNMLLLAIFAGVAMVLAAVGIYGILSYAVAQRTHEIGVRMALGARATDVLKLVVGQGLKLTLAGVAIGLAAAFGVTRVMESLLYEVSATDPVTFAAIALLLAGVALAASFIPALRATRVDPMVALRYE